MGYIHLSSVYCSKETYMPGPGVTCLEGGQMIRGLQPLASLPVPWLFVYMDLCTTPWVFLILGNGLWWTGPISLIKPLGNLVHLEHLVSSCLDYSSSVSTPLGCGVLPAMWPVPPWSLWVFIDTYDNKTRFLHPRALNQTVDFVGYWELLLGFVFLKYLLQKP